jgi:lipopolysaccharide transport system ATP-binding protein
MQSNTSGQISWYGDDRPGGDEFKLTSVRMLDEKGDVANTFYTNAAIQVEVQYEVLVDIVGARMVMQLADDSGAIIFSSTNHNLDSERKVTGFYKTVCVIPSNLLNKGKFNVLIHFGIPGVKVILMAQRFLSFNTLLMGNQGSTFSEIWPGMVAPKLEWTTKRINTLDNV